VALTSVIDAEGRLPDRAPAVAAVAAAADATPLRSSSASCARTTKLFLGFAWAGGSARPGGPAAPPRGTWPVAGDDAHPWSMVEVVQGRALRRSP